ncbi:MAG: hypothetical protein M3Q31_05255 [Actinomycetota bacterium]|nr:hypothetical protein [Actinomycetota bacterium]
MIRCPLCSTPEPKVIAYRKRTTRLECTNCRLRFSVNPLDIANTLRTRPRQVLAALPEPARISLAAEIVATGAYDTTDMEAAGKRLLQELGTAIAAGVLAKPNDTLEERKQRLRPLTGPL